MISVEDSSGEVVNIKKKEFRQCFAYHTARSAPIRFVLASVARFQIVSGDDSGYRSDLVSRPATEEHPFTLFKVARVRNANGTRLRETDTCCAGNNCGANKPSLIIGQLEPPLEFRPRAARVGVSGPK